MPKRFFLAFTLFAAINLSPHRGGTVDLPNIPDAGSAVPGALVPAPGVSVQLPVHKGEWSSFASMEGAAEPIFLITGQLKNTSDKPLAYVKFQFELLDEDGVVLIRDYGYNRKAEALREEDYESGKKSLKDMAIEQLTTGTEDSFRFLFFKSDIPEFRSYRIRIMETREAAQP